jgi:hypothetical protein
LHHDCTWRQTKDSLLELRLANWTATERPGTSPVCEDITQKENNSKGFAGQNLDQNLNLREGFTIAHLLQLVKLWLLVSPTQLHHEREDNIFWNLTTHHTYTIVSAYKDNLQNTKACHDLENLGVDI